MIMLTRYSERIFNPMRYTGINFMLFMYTTRLSSPPYNRLPLIIIKMVPNTVNVKFTVAFKVAVNLMFAQNPNYFQILSNFDNE